jgi:hypothetical protein
MKYNLAMACAAFSAKKMYCFSLLKIWLSCCRLRRNTLIFCSKNLVQNLFKKNVVAKF